MLTNDSALPRHVVISGAASGIGYAVVQLLLESNCQCTAFDRDGIGLERLANERKNGALLVRNVDVVDGRAVEECLDQAENEFGPIDGLVHAAGTLCAKSLLDETLTEEEFREVIRINLEGSFLMARAVGRRLSARKSGALVLVSSNAGTTPRANMGPYCASKAGVTMLARCLALELGPHNVRCNVVSPGSTDTPMLRSMLGASDYSGVIEGDAESFRVGIPLGKVGSPQDVARSVLFLLSDQAGHITGWDLRVDGGATWS